MRSQTKQATSKQVFSTSNINEVLPLTKRVSACSLFVLVQILYGEYSPPLLLFCWLNPLPPQAQLMI